MRTPPELDAIADKVLAYQPKDKAKKLRTKARKAKKGAKRNVGKAKADGEPIPATPYTPGPWAARDYATKEGHIWVDCEAWARRKDGVLVRSTMDSARTVGGTVATVMGTGAGEEWTTRANADLIAAAPDLAEDLAEALVFLSRLAQQKHEIGSPAAALIHEAGILASNARHTLARAGLTAIPHGLGTVG